MFAGGAGATIAVATLSALVVPPALVAVTRRRKVAPTSAGVRAYVLAVAPRTAAHPLPPASQRSHCWANAIGWVPLQVPSSDTPSVAPSRAAPDAVGAALLTGAAAVTTTVAADAATASPAALVAVTSTRSACPMSAPRGAEVLPAAPAMLAQPVPSAAQRRHW